MSLQLNAAMLAREVTVADAEEGPGGLPLDRQGPVELLLPPRITLTARHPATPDLQSEKIYYLIYDKLFYVYQNLRYIQICNGHNRQLCNEYQITRLIYIFVQLIFILVRIIIIMLTLNNLTISYPDIGHHCSYNKVQVFHTRP